MFYFIYKRNILQLILVLAGLALILFRILPEQCYLAVSDDIPIFSQGLVEWLNLRPGFFKGFILLNLFLQLLLLCICFNKNDLSDENASLMPALFYVGLLCSLRFSSAFSNIFFLNTLILIILLIAIYFNNPSMKGRVLMAGLLIGIGSILSATMLFMLIYCLVSLFIYRFSSTKDIVILFLGILLPFVYLFSYFYFTDQNYTWSMVFDKLVAFNFQSTFIHLGVNRLLLLFALSLLGFIVVFSQKVLFDNKAILLRSRLIALAVYFISTILVVLFDGEQFPYNLQYMFVPMAIYMSLESEVKKPRLRHDLYIAAFLVVVLLLNYL